MAFDWLEAARLGRYTDGHWNYFGNINATYHEIIDILNLIGSVRDSCGK